MVSPRQAALGIGILLLAGCSSILGLDEFKQGDGSSTGGSSGQGGTGGAAGSNNGGAGAGGTGATGGTLSGGTGGTSVGGNAGQSCTPPAEEDCYDGPSGTQDQGRCRGGKRQCSTEGVWQACASQVLPGVENCSTPNTDENCDGFECQITGASLPGAARAVAPLPNGGFVVATSFTGDVDLDQHIPAGGGNDVYIAAVDIKGAVEWSLPVTSGGNDSVYAITTSPGGRVYTLVYLGAPLDLGDGIKAAGCRLITQEADGSVVRTLNFDPAAELYSAAVDPAGSVVMAGWVAAPVTIGGTPLNPTFQDPLIVRVRADGSVAWAKLFKGANDNYALGVAADSAGNSYIVGNAQGTINLGQGDVTADEGDAYIARLDVNGNTTASALFGGPGVQEARFVAVDGSGHPLVAGIYTSTFSMGSSLPQASGEATFVAKLTLGSGGATADWLWNVNATTRGLSSDAAGGASLGLKTNAAFDLTEPVLANAGLVVRLSPTGSYSWHRQVGAPDGEVRALAGTADGETIVVGRTDSPTVDLGSGPVQTGQGHSYAIKLGF
ncbi:MAG: hypothetical protein AB7K71_15750 [Polyangiaceae bacterium]